MIRIGRLAGFSAKELEKFLNAFELCKLVMSTEAFRFAVYQSTFSDTRLTGAYVYNYIMAAGLSVNFSIETPVFWKRWFSREIAREVTGVGVIFNRSKYDSLDLPALAGVIFHECCHSANFNHTFWDTPQRNGSVPYKLGYLVEELARAMPAKNQVSEHLEACQETNS